MNLFEYLTKNPDASKTFSKAMGVYTDNFIDKILNEFDFSSYNTIADIDGKKEIPLIYWALKNDLS